MLTLCLSVVCCCCVLLNNFEMCVRVCVCVCVVFCGFSCCWKETINVIASVTRLWDTEDAHCRWVYSDTLSVGNRDLCDNKHLGCFFKPQDGLAFFYRFWKFIITYTRVVLMITKKERVGLIMKLDAKKKNQSYKYT